MNKTLSLFCLAIILYFSTIELKAQWQQVNLGPVGGEINSVAVFGQDILAGTTAGINRSTNNGVTWTNANGFMTLCFASIGSNIFAGTSSGVIISTDTGISWSTPNSSMPYYTNDLAVKDSIIFAGTNQNGIFRSTNNGNSWTAIDNGLGDNEVLALAVIGTTIYAGTAAGLYISTDNGNSWSTVVANNLSSLQFINCITGKGSDIFVGTPGGIIRSTDKGSTWGNADTGLNNGTSIFSILVNNSNVFIGTTAGVYVSTNDSGSWTPAKSGLPVYPSQVFSLAVGVNGASDTNLYAATNNGVYLTTNNGTSWTAENNGTVGTRVLSFTGIGPDIFAAIEGSPIFVSTDYGSIWNAAADGRLGSLLIQHLTITASGLYAATYDSGLFMSSNNGDNWSSINGGVMDTVHTYDLIQSGSNLVVSTQNNGIYYSSNNGTSWDKASGFMTQSPAVLSAIGSNVFVESGNGIYRSTDNGENWTELNDSFQNLGNNLGIVSIGSTLITATEGFPMVINSAGPTLDSLYRSTDNGKTWAPIITTIAPVQYLSYPISSLVTYDSDLFMVISASLMYVSTDSGNNWNSINNGGLPGSDITAFFVNDSSVFVGIYGSGIWKLPLSDIITAVKQPVLHSSAMSFTLWQNYPNPFNPTTIIGYDIPKLSQVTINVYDVLGRKVKAIVDAERLPGHYQVTFNANGLSSGVYFYRLTAGSFVQTKKLMVIK